MKPIIIFLWKQEKVFVEEICQEMIYEILQEK